MKWFVFIKTKIAPGLIAGASLLMLCACGNKKSAPPVGIPGTSAIKQFNDLNVQAAAAAKSGDKRKSVLIALQMQKLLNNAPDAVEAVAEAYAAARDDQKALASLQQFAGMKQADPDVISGKDKSFQFVGNSPQYQSILKQFTNSEAPVSLGKLVFTIPERNLLPEDITYDERSKSFLITSVLKKKIIRIDSNGKAADFAFSPHHWPMLAICADNKRGVLWATEVAMDGFASVPKSEWGQSAVLCYDMQTGTLRNDIILKFKGSPGDMTLDKNGEPLISDGTGGGVYKIANSRLIRIDGGDFISPQTPAMLRGDNRVFIPDYARGIGILNLENKQVYWLNQNDPVRYALNGVDGLYLNHGFLYLTQNGSSPECVARLQLDSVFKHIISRQIIEKAAPIPIDPTHGVIVGNYFYYIINSGWDKVDEHGILKPGAVASPAVVMRFRAP